MEQDKLILEKAADAIELLEDTIEELRNHPERLVYGEETIDYDPIMFGSQVESYIPQNYTVRIVMAPMEKS
jgi:hypothetical protein